MAGGASIKRQDDTLVIPLSSSPVSAMSKTRNRLAAGTISWLNCHRVLHRLDTSAVPRPKTFHRRGLHSLIPQEASKVISACWRSKCRPRISQVRTFTRSRLKPLETVERRLHSTVPTRCRKSVRALPHASTARGKSQPVGASWPRFSSERS